jgi:glyoxylase-like metal-dependent hydrolase (beta-lactamase superfamily II)
MITQITPNIWQLTFRFFGSCVYLLKLEGKNILIDTSSKVNRIELKSQLNELGLFPDDINIVLVTHAHFDHEGNIGIFDKAEIYGPKENYPTDEVLDVETLNINGLKVLKCPGHTQGDSCFFLEKEKILFSGDVIFHKGYIGRTDLPGADPEKMKESLEKLKKIDYKILLPGHLY